MNNPPNQVIPRRQFLLVGVLAFGLGLWTLLTNTARNDMIGVLIRPNFSVLIPQSLILIFALWQVLAYRSAAALIKIRHQTDLIQKRLALLVGAEVTLYFAIYYGMFALSGNPPFIDGSPLIGVLILLLRYLAVLSLGIVLVGAYQARHPGGLIVLVVFINLGYHYWLELNHLLIMYSPLYDPLYRAIHHLYQG